MGRSNELNQDMTIDKKDWGFWCIESGQERMEIDVESMRTITLFSADVESMRTITWFSADFNLNNKLLGKRIMAQAEKHKVLEQEQFGSRKNHRSNMVSLNHRLMFDLCWQRRQSLAIALVDAKSCYDRIVHNVANICLCRIDIPMEPLLCMFKTLQAAHHHVMTAFGVSEETYQSMMDIPLQGIGQGNGAGPSIWVLVNAPISKW